MNQTEITAIFEQQAAGYDAQWQHMWPVNNCLYLLLKGVFKSLKKERTCFMCRCWNWA